jgi:hypothetical protein
MKKLLAALLFLSSMSFAEDQLLSIDNFGGGIDIVSPAKMDAKYSPLNGILNVWTDEYGMITKRRGYIKYNTTPLSQLPIKKMYEYKQVDGDSYIIVNSSTAMYYSKGDTNFTAIVSTLSASYTDDYMTCNGFVYRSNGSDQPGKWDGATYTWLNVTNSTGMVNARYLEFFRNRTWWTGVDGAENIVYYSNSLDYQNIANAMAIAPQDGDEITGIKKCRDKMFVYKRKSMWEIYETSVGEYNYRQISNKYGSLYDSVIDEYQGFPVFVSDRGVELYTTGLTSLSDPIRNYMKDLRQLRTEQSDLTQTSAGDWGLGTAFVNVDTTTINGSVALLPKFALGMTRNGGDYLLELNALRQKIIPQEDLYSPSLVIYGTVYVVGAYTRFKVTINSANMTVITSSETNTNPDNPHVSGQTITFPDNFTLSAKTTYYICFSSVAGTDSNFQIFNYYFTDRYPYGGLQYLLNIPTPGGEADYYWTTYDAADDLSGFILAYTTASYSSQIQNAQNWQSWGTISIKDSQPSGSAISYYIKTSTANDNFSTRPGIPVSNGSVINSTIGNYVQVIASFTRTSAIVNPQLDEFSISYFGTGSNPPVGITYKDRYYLFHSTGEASTINDTVLILQKDGQFTIHNNIYAGSACIFRDDFYTGSSQNTGYVYKQDVTSRFTDALGENYDSYWTTKYLAAHPLYRTYYKDLWITADAQAGGSLDVQYRTDGLEGAWTAKSVSLTNSFGIVRAKLPNDILSNYRYMQYRIGSSTNDFKIHRIDLTYSTDWNKE